MTDQDARWGCFRCGLEMPLDQAPANCPKCPPAWLSASIAATNFRLGEKPLTQTCEGTAEVVAAFLRTVANQIDPPPSPAQVASALIKMTGS